MKYGSTAVPVAQGETTKPQVGIDLVVRAHLNDFFCVVQIGDLKIGQSILIGFWPVILTKISGCRCAASLRSK